jgi:hypothetical protein
MFRRRRTTRQLLVLLAMRRSGQHAVGQFIYRMYGAPKRFCNNRKLEARTFGKSKGDRFEGDVKSDLELFIVNYEDHRVADDVACPRCLIQNYPSVVGQARSSRYLLCLRDPFNLFASRLKQYEGRVTPEKRIRNAQATAELWKNHAWEFTGRSRFLPNLVAINYNDWVSAESYREELAGRLGVPYKGEGWNRTTHAGGGSTFDKKTFEKADEMKLFERWQVVRDDPVYRALFRDSEIIELSEEIFGPIPGTEEFYT